MPSDATRWIEIVQHNQDKRNYILDTLAKKNTSLHLHASHFYPVDLVTHKDGRTSLKDKTSFDVNPRFRSNYEILNNTQDAKRELSSPLVSSPPATPLLPTSDEDLKAFCRKNFCRERPLTLAEVYAILRKPNKYFSAPSSTSGAPFPPPQHGGLFLYDVSTPPRYTSDDDLPWVKPSEQEQKLPDGAVAVTTVECRLYKEDGGLSKEDSDDDAGDGNESDDDGGESDEHAASAATEMEDMEDDRPITTFHRYEYRLCKKDDGQSKEDSDDAGDGNESDDGESDEHEDDGPSWPHPNQLVLVHYYDKNYVHWGGHPGATVAASWLSNPPPEPEVRRALQRGHTLSLAPLDLWTYKPPWVTIQDLTYMDGAPISNQDYEDVLDVADLRNSHISDEAFKSSLGNIFTKAGWSPEDLIAKGIGPQMIGDTWLQPRINPALFFIVQLALLRMNKTLKEKGAGSGVADDSECWRDRNGRNDLYEEQQQRGELAGRKTSYRDLETKHICEREGSYTAFFRYCVQVNGYDVNTAVLSNSEKSFFRMIVDKIRRLLRRVAGLLQRGLLQRDECRPKETTLPRKRRFTSDLLRSRSEAVRVAAEVLGEQQGGPGGEQQQGGADAEGLSSSDSDVSESEEVAEAYDDKRPPSQPPPSQPPPNREALICALGALTTRGKELTEEIKTLTLSAVEFKCALYELSVMNLRLCKLVAQLGQVHCIDCGFIVDKIANGKQSKRRKRPDLKLSPFLLSKRYNVLREHIAAVDDVLKAAKNGDFKSVFVLNLPQSGKEACGQREAHHVSLKNIAAYKSKLDKEINRMEEEDESSRRGSSNSLKETYDAAMARATRATIERREQSKGRVDLSARRRVNSAPVDFTTLTDDTTTLTKLTEMVAEAEHLYKILDARRAALCDRDDTDKAQVKNVKTVERDELLTLWGRVAVIGLHRYDLQEIEADAKKLEDSTELRLEAYELRRDLCSEIKDQLKVAERKLQDNSFFTNVHKTEKIYRKTKTLERTLERNIVLLRKYVECLEKDIATSERDDEDVKNALAEGEQSLSSASQRRNKRKVNIAKREEEDAKRAKRAKRARNKC